MRTRWAWFVIAAGVGILGSSCSDDVTNVTNVTEQAGVKASSLEFRLTWTAIGGVDPDLDIVVHDPVGNVLSWSGMGAVSSTPQGGALGADDAGSCGGATAGEVAEWAAAPPPGTYVVGLSYVDECDFDGTVEQPPAPYTVEILVDGEVYENFTGTVARFERKQVGNIIVALP